MGLLVAASEIALAAALLADPRSRRWVQVSVGLLVLYSLVLVRLLFMDDPPSCGCLSVPGLRGTTEEAAAGLLRNAALIWLGSVALRTPIDRARRTGRQTSPASRRAAGFTLIEVLVTISIIAILTGILLPALAGARRQAQLTRFSVMQRQLNLALTQYAHDHDASMPYFASRNDPYSAVRIGTETFEGFSYFSAQVNLWATPLVPVYIPDRSMIEDEELRQWMSEQGRPGVVLARSALTATAFAAPEYFTLAARHLPVNYGHFRPTRLWEVRFPSDKALLSSYGAIGSINDLDAIQVHGHPCSFADGSAATYPTRVIDDWPAVAVPWLGTIPILTTEDGLAGRDR